MARTIVVGDVHGCPDELHHLLEKVGYAQGVDKLVLVGDLVARGPDSGRAVTLAARSGALAVRGNHDERVLRWWRTAQKQGGAEADRTVRLGEKHRLVIEQLSDDDFVYLDGLPLMLSLPEHQASVVHAGADPNKPLDVQDPDVLLTVRSIDAEGRPTRVILDLPWAERWAGPPHIIFGHDARRGLQLARHATGLDTGCCYGRALTALVLDRGEPVPESPEQRRRRLVSVPAFQAYCPIGEGGGRD